MVKHFLFCGDKRASENHCVVRSKTSMKMTIFAAASKSRREERRNEYGYQERKTHMIPSSNDMNMAIFAAALSCTRRSFPSPPGISWNEKPCRATANTKISTFHDTSGCTTLLSCERKCVLLPHGSLGNEKPLGAAAKERSHQSTKSSTVQQLWPAPLLSRQSHPKFVQNLLQCITEGYFRNGRSKCKSCDGK